MTAAAPAAPRQPDAAPAAWGGLALAEVRQDQASGHVARIYGELRDVAGYDLVPLFYRVLASDEAALCWCWYVLEPAFRHGIVAGAARAAVPPGGRRHARLPVPARAVLGLSPSDLAEARAVVEGFNRANPFNLTVLLLLEQALREGAVTERPSAGTEAAVAPPPGVAHRAPLEPSALPPDMLALVHWLSTRGGRERFATAPTLWRCLAHWPNLLALAAVQMEPLYAAGTVDEAARAIRHAVAQALRSRPGTESSRRSVAAAEPEQAAHVSRTIAFFAAKIPEMIFTGHVLHSLLTEE